jgi:hypothetical protein
METPMWDFVTGKMSTGIRLVDAYQRIKSVCVDSGRQVMVRRVMPWTDSLYDAIKKIRETHAGGKYQNNLFALLEALKLSDEDQGDMMVVRQYREKRETTKKGIRRAFCSQLVARILTEAGILPEYPSASFYSPGDFDFGGAVDIEMHQRGFSMTPPSSLLFD